MLARYLLPATIVAILTSQPMGRADPITYDFSGAFNQPVNGTDYFSGSFTVNGNPTDGGGVISENGADVSILVNLGGQVINYVNTPQDPYAATFSVAPEPASSEVPSGVPENVLSVIGTSSVANAGSGFSITFYSPGPPVQIPDLRNINYMLAASSVGYSNWSGGSEQGVITSIELVSAPEPGTLAVFGVLGLAALMYQSRFGLR